MTEFLNPQYLIWGGGGVTLLGVGFLMWCVRLVAQARKIHSDEQALRTALQGVVPWNLAGLFLSAIGLMMVVIGLMFA